MQRHLLDILNPRHFVTGTSGQAKNHGRSVLEILPRLPWTSAMLNYAGDSYRCIVSFDGKSDN